MRPSPTWGMLDHQDQRSYRKPSEGRQAPYKLASLCPTSDDFLQFLQGFSLSKVPPCLLSCHLLLEGGPQCFELLDQAFPLGVVFARRASRAVGSLKRLYAFVYAPHRLPPPFFAISSRASSLSSSSPCSFTFSSTETARR